VTAIDLSSLPADVVAALRRAFPDGPLEGLELLSGGMSQAMLLAFRAGDQAYVLRRGVKERAATAAACMRIAGELGVGPRLVHVDEGSGFCIMHRVPGAPLRRDPGLAEGRLERVARALRALHDGPAFPGFTPLAETIAFFEGVSRQLSGEGLPQEIVAALERVAPLLAPFAAQAPCHRDLNPNNILETADRVFFVDWEMAGQGDPYVDLGQLGVFAFSAPADREALLAAYLGRAPTTDERARAILARVVALAVYALAFRNVQMQVGERLPAGTEAPKLAELFAALAALREKMSPGRLALALQREVRELVASPEFADAAARFATPH